MFDEFREIQNNGAHGDIIFWPIKALCENIEQTGNLEILDKGVVYTDAKSFAFTAEAEPLHKHARKALNYIYPTSVEGTALPCYGEGDWDDLLQPANPAMKTRLVSGWTAALAYQTLTALSVVWRIAGFTRDVEELDVFLLRMKYDFQAHLIKDGVVAGFVLFDGEKTSHMLHPSDNVTGIHYRQLPTAQRPSGDF